MQQFWLLNLQFVTLIAATLVYFAVAWLFWDSYKAKPDKVNRSRAIGFLILSISSVAGIFSSTNAAVEMLFTAGYLIGLAVIAIGIVQEKINPLPLNKTNPPAKTEPRKKTKTLAATPAIFLLLPFLSAIVTAYSSIQLWKRYTVGLVREYKLWFISWIFLTLTQVVYGFGYFRNSTNVILEQLSHPYGTAWTIGLLLHLISVIILGLWIWNYLRFRIEPQLFLAFVAISVIISTFSAVVYSTLLFSSSEREFTQQLQTNVETATFNITQLKQNALSSANILSKSEIIRKSLATNNLSQLFNTVTDYSGSAEGIDYILVSDRSGTILVKTDEFAVVGDKTLSNDPIVVHAIQAKESRVSIVEKADVLANRLEVVATAPILSDEGSTLGVLQVGYVLDNAYADKLKNQTQLEVTFYTDDKRSATTILAADGKSRAENTTETNPQVLNTVIKQRSIYTGVSTVLGVPYYTAYAPLFEVNNNVVGMISVSREQIILVETVRNAIFNTFLVSVLISILALMPAEALSKYISRNYRA